MILKTKKNISQHNIPQLLIYFVFLLIIIRSIPFIASSIFIGFFSFGQFLDSGIERNETIIGSIISLIGISIYFLYAFYGLKGITRILESPSPLDKINSRKSEFILFITFSYLFHIAPYGISPIENALHDTGILQISNIAPEYLVDIPILFILASFNEKIRAFIKKLSSLIENHTQTNTARKRQKTNDTNNRSENYIIKSDPVSDKLRQRALYSRISAYIILIFIVALIIGLSAIILRTLQETSLAAPTSGIGRLIQEESDVREKINNASLQLSEAFHSIGISSEISGLGDIGSGPVPQINYSYILKDMNSKIKEEEKNDIKSLILRYNNLAVSLSAIIERRANEKSTDQSVSDRNFFYSAAQSTLVRIGFAIVILYLVGLLFNLYRYITRLAAAYDSQADAIELIVYDSEKLKTLVEALSPEAYDFGKPPNTPMKEVSRLLAAASNIRGKATEK
ncbi:hypothetical protein [Nisaea sediminum]|uniref:hypothetical protein n=1 Tax=Nisaea sediminum TaxID=2775867 RepID=UPI001868AD65|nr:hypothetical protein [Nisaea sediminum]